MNRRGFAEVALLLWVLAGVVLFFVPNPVSSSLGIGIRPNKTVQTEKVDLIKDKEGNPIALRTITSNQDIQQHVTLWEQVRSLPVLFLILMGLGIISVPSMAWLQNERIKLLTGAKKIVQSVDKGLAVIKAKDPALHQAALDAMSKVQGENSATEALVTDLQQKQ